MAAITASMVNDLRQKTGCGMMECKKALTEANGDVDEAIKLLREKGLAVAAKKASRIAAEGVVDILVADDNKSAAMIEVNAETDFVAKNQTFLDFVKNILKTILATRPANVEELLTKQYVDTDMTVEAKLKDMVFTIGENMNIRRFIIVDGVVGTYIHGKGSTGVIVSYEADEAVVNADGFAEFAKNIALQVAGAPSPVLYLNKESVPERISTKRSLSSWLSLLTILRTLTSRHRFLKRWLQVSLVSSMKRTACLSRSTLRKTRCLFLSMLRTQLRHLAALSRLQATICSRRAKALKREKTTLQLKLQRWLRANTSKIWTVFTVHFLLLYLLFDKIIVLCIQSVLWR